MMFQVLSRWWFEIFVDFSPQKNWGNDPISLLGHIFQMGWKSSTTNVGHLFSAELKKKTWLFSDFPVPMGSMYGIFSYIGLIFMVNVGKYTIHGS